MKKRVISAVLTVMLVFGYASFNLVSAIEDAAVLEDKLETLGISCEGLFDGQNISRADFAILMTEFMNITVEETHSYTSFIDVKISDKANSAINTLYERGYISGTGGYRFEPERKITCAEALSIIVNALGYKINAEVYGGYYQGVSNVVTNLNLLEDVSCDIYGQIKKADLLKIIDNALKAKVMMISYNGSTYSLDGDNKLAIEVYHNIHIKEGIVTANQYTSLVDSNGTWEEDEIIVDGMKLEGAEAAVKYLGYSVECYYTDDEEIYKSVYIEPSKRNVITEYDGNDVIGIADGALRYYDENDKEKKFNLDTLGLKIIYNGVAYTGYGDISNINFADSDVLLLSNDKDKDAEIIFITKYDDYYVSSVDIKNKMISDAMNNRTVYLDDEDYFVKIYDQTGNETEFGAIKTDTVLSVATSVNTTGKIVKTAYISTATAEGNVSAYDDENGYEINGSFYRLSAACTKSIAMGQNIKVFLGKKGNIVARNLLADTQFGVFYRCYTDYTGTGDVVKIEIFTRDGEFVEYVADRRIKIDNSYVDATEAAIYANLSRGQTIVYDSRDGQIVKIRKPKPVTADKDEFRLIDSGNALSIMGSAYDGLILAGQVAGDFTKMKIMYIPTDPSKKEEYSVFTGSSMANETLKGNQYAIYSYRESKITSADVLVLFDAAAAELIDTSSIYVVKKIYDGLDADDIPTTFMQVADEENQTYNYAVESVLDTTTNAGYQNIAITQIKGVNLSSVGKGDVVRIALGSNGKIAKIEKILDVEDRNDADSRLKPTVKLVDTATHYNGTGKYLEMSRVVYSKIGGFEGGLLQFETSTYATFDDFKFNQNVIMRDELGMLKSGPRVVLYDKESGETTGITRDEINNYIGKECVLHIYQMNITEVIIYE